ncbi:hypothetical protein [Pigmentibacter ruber]|uniref:hypothetical protein n=1 Tax=Pigmentibacter ruber TaxID=2683196 RepID=UPI00131AFB1E|nr:hypothetical protein [Pigmentibacter ruber]BFD33084.1 hypothetical protein GTC16762_27020 [Pigmentibacter ruber]
MKYVKYIFLFINVFLFQLVYANFSQSQSQQEVFSQYFKPTIDCTWLRKCNFKQNKKEPVTKFRFVL